MTSAGWPGSGSAASRCWSSPSARPRAWRRCRRSSASSPRKPTTKPSCTVSHWARAAPFVLAAIVVGSVFTTIYSLRFLWGAFARKGQAGTQQAGREHARAAGHVPGRARGPGRGGPGVRAVARAAGPMRWTPTPTRFPAERDYDLALWHGVRTCRCCCRSLVLAVGTAAFFGRARLPPDAAGLPAAGQRRPHLRRGDPRRRRALGAADRHHPARLDPRHPVGDPVDAGGRAGGGAGARRARPARVRAVGARRCRWSSAC